MEIGVNNAKYYFVSYNWTRGSGNISIEINTKEFNYKKIQEFIKEQFNVENCVIINYIEISKEIYENQ